MKKSILFVIAIIFISHSHSFGQNQNNKKNHSQNSSNETNQFKPNSEKMANIIFYDAAEVIKLVKMKESEKQLIIENAIKNYNNKINELKIFNFDVFNKANSLLEKIENNAMQKQDYVLRTELREKAQELIAPVKEKALIQQQQLNNVFQQEFTENQYKKWLKYQKKK